MANASPRMAKLDVQPNKTNMTQFPYETFNELTDRLKRGIESNEDGIIHVSQEEMDMYTSYAYPKTEEEPTPEVPENVTFQGFTLRVK